MISAEELNQRGAKGLPGHIGLVVTLATTQALEAEILVAAHHMAPNGFLHAGTLVALADTCCGYGCVINLPDGANGFTTVELKSNHLATTRDGSITCRATPAHLGRTTQVWDAIVKHRESDRTLAIFRCTQMVLYPRADRAA